MHLLFFREHAGHKCADFEAASKTSLLDIDKLLEPMCLRKTELQDAVRKVESVIASEQQECLSI